MKRRTQDEAQKEYDRLRETGMAPKLAEMLALQRGPVIRTDSTFMEGWHCTDQFEAKHPRLKAVGDDYRKKAEAAGVRTRGKRYLHQLATEPGDVRAWVDSRGDVQRRLEELGWGCKGAVNTQVADSQVETETPYRVADSIVNERYADYLDQNPEAATATKREKVELKEKIREAISPTPAE